MVRTPAAANIGRPFSFAETTSIEKRRLRKEIRRETTTMTGDEARGCSNLPLQVAPSKQLL